MKIRSLFLFLFAGYFGWAQKTTGNPPNTQMKQMEKELKELEKDDPEMMKQKKPGKKTPQSSVSTTKFISPVTPITVKTPVAPPGAAQATDRLLWFKGKKIDDSTLITTYATLVRWSKPRDMVIVQPKKDPFTKILSELAKTEQRKEQFYNKVAERKSSVIMYPAINNTLKEFDRLLKFYSDILKNTLHLPPAIKTSTAYKNTGSHGGTASLQHYILNNFFALPADIKKAYQEVMAAMKNYPPIDFPPPPEMQFGTCYSALCDSTAYNEQFKKRETWQEEFIKYEADIISKSLSIIKTIGQNENLQKDPETASIEAGLKKAMNFATARINNKTDLLIRKYGKDFKQLPAVVSIVLSAERQKQLLGFTDEASGTKIARLASLFDGFEKFIEQQMDAKNYDVALNMAFIIGTERQRQLLAGGEENNMSDLMEKINAFNRFKMDVQFDYKGEWEDCGIEKASFTATNLEEVHVSLGLVNCKYNFFWIEGVDEKNSSYPIHYRSDYSIPLQVTNGTGTESKYSEDGEKCWQIQHNLKGLVINPYGPIASISFCENEKEDSLQFDVLHLAGSHENREDIRYNYARFEHFDELMQHDGLEESTNEIEEYRTELQELKHDLSDFPEMEQFAKHSLSEMEKLHFEINRVRWLRAKINEYEERNNPSVIVFDAKNGNEVIIDEKTYKSYSDTVGDNHEKANVTIKIKITHAPLPYKKTEPKKN